MKAFFGYLVLAIAAVGLGVAAGVEYCRYQYMDVQEPFYTGQWDQSIRDRMRPILVVAGGFQHEFGTIKVGEPYRHEFIFENLGDAPLEIQLIEKSDNVSVDLGSDKQTLAPGVSLPVELTWIPTGDDDRSGYCLLMTNDSAAGHDRVRLDVTGK